MPAVRAEDKRSRVTAETQRPQHKALPVCRAAAAQLSVFSLQYCPLSRLDAAEPQPHLETVRRASPGSLRSPSRPEAVSAGHRDSPWLHGPQWGPTHSGPESNRPLQGCDRAFQSRHARCGDRGAWDPSPSSAADALAQGGPRGSRFPHLSSGNTGGITKTTGEPITQRRHILGVRQYQSHHTARNLRHVEPAFSVPKKLFF